MSWLRRECVRFLVLYCKKMVQLVYDTTARTFVLKIGSHIHVATSKSAFHVPIFNVANSGKKLSGLAVGVGAQETFRCLIKGWY